MISSIHAQTHALRVFVCIEKLPSPIVVTCASLASGVSIEAHNRGADNCFLEPSCMESVQEPSLALHLLVE